ncbi:MAG TPA: AMP-binding protein [Acidimicrobiales bacterium]|nr:AMP-binding protein [Acidimicrobiales bacterium]
MTPAAPIDGRTLWEVLARRVDATPDLEMACDQDGNRVTFAETARRAEAVAASMAARGVREGTVVSWTLPTSIDAIAVAVGLARLGAVQNPIVPIYREREVGFCTAQAGTELLVVPDRWRGFDYAGMARSVAERNGRIEVVVAGPDGLFDGDPDAAPVPVVPPERPEDGPVRWLMYTSGTTADPKGARHVDNAMRVIAQGIADRYEVELGDRCSLTFPITHIGGITWLYVSCQRGTALLLEEAFHPRRTPAFLAREGCTHAGSATPFHQAYLAAQRERPDVPLFPNLKACPGGGAPKPPELHYEVKRELGGAGIVSGWGLTEAPILTTAFFSDDDERLARTEGAPLPGVEVVVVKADGSRAAVGEEGELRAKGPQLMRGYVDASLDADAFDADGYFRTGDLGYLDELGYVVVSGRLKDVIIRNGENVAAKEVEDLLYTAPGVADVAVVGLPDPRTGERVCAVVVADEPADPVSLEDLVAFLRRQGVRNQALPEQLELVDELPRNATGKVKKNELRDRFGVAAAGR